MLWLPIIGPIIQGIVSIFTKWQDTKLGTLTIERNDDVEEAKVSAQIIQATQDDIGLRFMRDLLIFPVVVWTMLLCWDTIVALHYPKLMWHLATFDKTGAPYLPYAVIVFLLGNIGINMWTRK